MPSCSCSSMLSSSLCFFFLEEEELFRLLLVLRGVSGASLLSNAGGGIASAIVVSLSSAFLGDERSIVVCWILLRADGDRIDIASSSNPFKSSADTKQLRRDRIDLLLAWCISSSSLNSLACCARRCLDFAVMSSMNLSKEAWWWWFG